MANGETLLDGIVNIRVENAEQAYADIQQAMQRIAQAMQQSGQIPSTGFGSDLAEQINQGFSSVQQMNQALMTMRQLMDDAPKKNMGAERYFEQVKAVELLDQKLQQVIKSEDQYQAKNAQRSSAVASAEAEALRLRAEQDRAARERGFGGGYAGAQRTNQVDAANRQVSKAEQAMTSEDSKLQAAKERQRAAAEQLARAELELGVATDVLEQARRLQAAKERLGGVATRDSQALAGRLGMVGAPGPERLVAEAEKQLEAASARAAAARADSTRTDEQVSESQAKLQRISEELASRRAAAVSLEERLQAEAQRQGQQVDLQKNVQRIREQVAPTEVDPDADSVRVAQARLLNARDQLAEAVRAEYETTEERNNAERAAYARYDQASLSLERAIKRREEANEKAATADEKYASAAAEAAAVRDDPRRELLQKDGDEFLAATGLDESKSLNMQKLLLEQQTLLATRQELIAKASSVDTEKDLDKLYKQRESLERRILANTSSIEQVGMRDMGKGGFWGGVMGGFGGQRASGMEEISFQAGQSAKYFAMYQALRLVQNGMSTLISTAIELSQAQVDLAITMGVSTEEAAGLMQEYARVGRVYATGPVEASQGAGRFQRVFREDDGSVDPSVGRQGALLASLINVNEGQQRIEATMTDLTALARAFGTGSAGTLSYYDQATFIARQYGFQSGGDIASGAAAIGDIGKDLGYKPQELMALIAGVMQQTGVSSDAAAGDVKRILGEAESPDMNEMFREFGISLDQSFAQRMQELNRQMSGLSQEERLNILSAVGSARTGAAAASMLSGMDRANQVLGLAEEQAPGFASDLAKRQLEELAGSLKELHREIVQIAGALAQAGFGGMLTTIVQATTNVLRAIGMVADVFSLLPGPMKEFIAFLVTAAAVGKAGQAAQGALVARGIVGAGGAANAVPAAAAGANIEALVRARTLARFGGNTAEVTALNAQIAAARQASTATAGFSGALRNTASGLGTVVRALGPFAAALAALSLIGEKRDLGNRRDSAAETGSEAEVSFEKALVQGDIEGMRSAITQLQTAQKEYASTREGFWSNFLNIGSIGVGSAWLRGEEGAPVWETEHGEVKRKEAELEARLNSYNEQLDELLARYAAMDANTPSTEWFGPGYAKSAFGVQQIQESGLAVDPSIRAFRDFTMHAPRLSSVLRPEGEGGATDLFKHVADQIKRLNNPLDQESGMGEMLDALRALQGRVNASGTEPQKNMVAFMVEDANRAYSDLVTKNAQLRIENIKAMQEESPAAVQSIRELITTAMIEVGGTGDVNATISLLAGVDKMFLNTYREHLLAQITIIENSLAALEEAERMSMQAMVASLGNRPGLSKTLPQDLAELQATSPAGAKRAELEEMRRALETFDIARPLSAPKGSSFEWGGGSGPSAQDIEIARLRAQAISGDPVSEARAQLRVAEYELKNAENQQEYWNAVKAVNDAKHSLARAELDASTATIMEGARAGDPLSQAAANVRVAHAQLRGAVGTAAYRQGLQQLEEANLAYSRAQLEISIAAVQAAVLPGDPLSSARANLDTAQRQLRAAVGRAEYYQALKSLRDAQYELAQLELTRAQNARLLQIDITDPVATANAEVEAAKRQLAFNQGRGASQDVILADQVALRQAQTDAAGAAWDQQFSDAQTNYDLQRTSLTAYLSYLNAQRDYLMSVQNKTRQQVEQLNQVDQALKGLSEGLQGQWNLGDIKVPSPYEMRRVLAGEGSYAGTQHTTYVDLQINGANMAEVQQLLAQYLGRGVVQAASTAPPR